jgi:hypothetical protein
MTSEARAQKSWEKRVQRLKRDAQICVRCNYARAFHNRGNRWYEPDICKRFKEGE